MKSNYQAENEIAKKDKFLARHMVTKYRGQAGRKKLEKWLNDKGTQEQYWRELFNEVRVA